MSDRELKFKYKPPSTHEENIEAIYEELSEVENGGKYYSKETLKSYVFQILKQIKQSVRQKESIKKRDELNISSALGLLSFIAIIFIASGSRESNEFDWLGQNSFTIKLWGIALAAIYLGTSIERTAFFRSVWQFNFTKLIVSISLSGLVVFSTGKAAAVINSVFGVDAAAFPFTLVFTSALIVFHYVFPIMALIGVAAFFHVFNAIGWLKSKIWKETYEFPPMDSFVFPLLTCILLFIFWGWLNDDLSPKKMPQKVYKLAHLLDFNAKHECSNIKIGTPVIFLGTSQNIVLADTNRVVESDVKSFFKGNINIPESFFRLKCELPTYNSK